MRINRKEIKRRARHVVKRHYFLLVALCLVAAAIGTEFTGSLDFLKIPSGEPVAVETANAVVTGQPTMGSVIVETLDGRSDESKKTAEELQKQAIRNTEERSGAVILGRSRGVLAHLVNEISSGALLATVITAVQSILGSVRMTWIVFIILSVLLFCAVNYLFINIYTVISRRMFLESRIYEKVPVQRLVYLLRVKKWMKVSWTMLVVRFFQLLWLFTIIGGVIKYYAYFLVPYIVAENPDISAKQAIRLSQDMMCFSCFL